LRLKIFILFFLLLAFKSYGQDVNNVDDFLNVIREVNKIIGTDEFYGTEKIDSVLSSYKEVHDFYEEKSPFITKNAELGNGMTRILHFVNRI